MFYSYGSDASRFAGLDLKIKFALKGPTADEHQTWAWRVAVRFLMFFNEAEISFSIFLRQQTWKSRESFEKQHSQLETFNGRLNPRS